MLASYADESLTDTISARLESIIDRLYRLSFRIRSPATRLGTSKASGYRDIDESSGVDLIEVLAEADRKHIRELLKQISGAPFDDNNENYLVSRLSKANTLRRQQFGQWKRHREKLKGPKPMQNMLLENETRPRLPLGERSNPRGLLSPGEKESSRPSTATRILDRHIDLDDNRSMVSTSTYAQLHDSDSTVEFMPIPPNIPGDRKELECPYCYILCSSKTFEKRAWECVFSNLSSA